MPASVVASTGDRLYFRTKQRETPAGRRLHFYDFDEFSQKSPPPVKRVVRDAGYKPALLASV